MTSERVCSRCGKGGLPPRCRVHTECLSSGVSVKRAPKEPARESVFLEPDAGRFMVDEPRWVITDKGARVWTAEVIGYSHTEGILVRVDDDPEADDAPASATARVSDEHLVIARTVSEYSPFEASFPAVVLKGAREKEVPEPVSASRSEIIAQLLTLADENFAAVTAAARDKVLGSVTARPRTKEEADAIANAALAEAKSRGWL